MKNARLIYADDKYGLEIWKQNNIWWLLRDYNVYVISFRLDQIRKHFNELVNEINGN